MEVRAWTERISISTYPVGQPEKNPMFLEKRVYQGSSGVVYPHPVIEKISDTKQEQEYEAVFLENDYLRIMILPELGGRVQRAYDKVTGRDFVYYNQVIKPALVGLAGPWISGGIEFNWPQHHRPSTYSPVDCTIEEFADGSKTVWVNEIEQMFRTKGVAGFTLYPDKAYLEIKGKVFNRSPFPQTFLWWANPAVKVNDAYQSVFPPDVYAVFDHGKRDVSDFPIATGTYYKVDYSPGTDISRYANIPVPTSYMAIRSDYNFIGCYEHDTHAGMLHVANHHVSPGKKQWTWGNGDFGQAWDRNLTDEDGPYIELMTGVFTDNQPDFSWLQPNEEKTFEQYFMPYSRVGQVKNASKEAMLNLEWIGSVLAIKVYATAEYAGARVILLNKGKSVREWTRTISPREVFEEEYKPETKGSTADWGLVVTDSAGVVLIAWQDSDSQSMEKAIPSPATAALPPGEIAEIEELYLNGLHLEQYRHATYNPVDYYSEALRRSPGDLRCNNAMGLLLLRRGKFAQAEPYFRRAIASLTRRNPNPYDGEAYYNLGWSLKLQGNLPAAFDAFYKATWNDAWQHSGFLALARIASEQGDFSQALQLVDKSLVRNYNSPVARHLKAILLQKNGLTSDSFIAESLTIDPFNFGCLFESKAATFEKLMRGSLNNYLELSLDYAQAGFYEDADRVLEICPATSPLIGYYRGWFSSKMGRMDSARFYEKGAQADPSGCFPNKIEEILIFEDAMRLNPEDGRAAYYLGNLWYDKRQYSKAIECWEIARIKDKGFPTVFRNLALAYYNKLGRKTEAVQLLERAFELDPSDARVLMELDQLYKITGRSIAQRLEILEQYPELVDQRDDLYLERITLYNDLNRYQTARKLIADRKFHPWEGGEGKVVRQFLHCHLELAKQAILAGNWNEASRLLEATETYPENLGEGKLYGTQENDRYFLMGLVCEGMGAEVKARELFKAATVGISQPVQAIYYNDPQPDKIVYQALAWARLGQPEKARSIFESFIQFGQSHMEDEITIDYFAVSLPDMLVFDQNINQRNRVHCTYLIGLGWLGLGDGRKAKHYLNEVLEVDPYHQGAAVHLQMVQIFQQVLKQESAW